MTKRLNVCSEALTWLGTPYHHLGDIKRSGVDCAMLIVRVYVALGLAPAGLDPRPYAPDWHLHRSEEKYLDWVTQFGHEVDTPLPGDIALWQFGRTYSHAAIVLDTDGSIIHAYRDAGGVVLGNLSETALRARPTRYFTINGIED
jgi:cell wall-associated NlpC family hydrolase